MTPLSQALPRYSDFSINRQDANASLMAEFGRLINAAIVSRSFREMLLIDPNKSIEMGYCGESFSFPHEFRIQIQQVKAGCLEDFASEVLQVINTPVPAEKVLVVK